MDILLIGSESMARLEGFKHFVADRGCKVHRLLPNQSTPALSQDTEGVVFFDDGSPILPEWVARLRESTRYLSLPLIAVAAGSTSNAMHRLQATGATSIFGPEISDSHILQQIQSCRDVKPVIGEIRKTLLEPFKAATLLTMREMAGTAVAVRSEYQKAQYKIFGDVSAVLGLMSVAEGSLVLSLPLETARAVAHHALADVTDDIDDEMVGDCVGEIANVIAGQAKGLLRGTRFQFTFSTPTIVAGVGHEIRHKPGMDCLVIAFTSDLGDFALQLCLSV